MYSDQHEIEGLPPRAFVLDADVVLLSKPINKVAGLALKLTELGFGFPNLSNVLGSNSGSGPHQPEQPQCGFQYELVSITWAARSCCQLCTVDLHTTLCEAHSPNQMRADPTLVHGQDSGGPASTGGIKAIAIRSAKDNTTDTTTEITNTESQPPETSVMTQNIWIFIFRGLPYDTYNRRHTIFYLDSPDVENFHITAHAQRPTEKEPYEYIEVDGEEVYPMSVDLIHGRLVGRVQVDKSDPRKLLDTIALTPVNGEPDWNCQHFVYNALERLTEAGVLSEEQVNDTKEWMMDSLLDGAIA